MEKLQAERLPDGSFRAMHSPLFVRNLARGDQFRLASPAGGKFAIVERSGNLAIRVFRREGIAEVADWLTPKAEKLDGTLDLSTPMALVYSLHVNVGFSPLETLFDNAVSTFSGTMWYYGNVYDPSDGATPLNWWDAFINQI